MTQCHAERIRKTRDSKRHTVDEPIHSQALCEICNGVEDRKNEVLQCPETTIERQSEPPETSQERPILEAFLRKQAVVLRSSSPIQHCLKKVHLHPLCGYQ